MEGGGLGRGKHRILQDEGSNDFFCAEAADAALAPGRVFFPSWHRCLLDGCVKVCAAAKLMPGAWWVQLRDRLVGLGGGSGRHTSRPLCMYVPARCLCSPLRLIELAVRRRLLSGTSVVPCFPPTPRGPETLQSIVRPSGCITTPKLKI